MPTGYTSDIYAGKKVSFQEFALNCARAFGALIELRDSPRDAKIPNEFKPSDYHTKELKEANKKLNQAQEFSDTEIGVLAKQDYEKSLESYNEYKQKGLELKGRYEEMLTHVEAYQAPSPDHIEFKNFMVEQLKNSIKYDTNYHGERPNLKTPEEWRKDEIKSATWSINYHSEEHAKEVEWCAEKTEWVRKLKESLKKV